MAAALLELNNVRNHGAYILLNVNGTGWNATTKHAPSGAKTTITIEDCNGNTPNPFNSLLIRFLSSSSASGSGKGELDAQASGGANAATVVLGNSGGSPQPQYDACLGLELNNAIVSTAFGYIESTG